VLNVYPRLRPALNNFYPKLKGRRDSTAQIWVNNSIREDFSWAIKTLNTSSGIRLLKSLQWNCEDATLTVYCDACPEGMGFWYPELNMGFYSPTPSYEHPDLIFYFEALCVQSALFDAHRRTTEKGKGRFLVFTDNMNTVDIFNSFRALPPYNHLLKAAVDTLNNGDHDMRILHIAGTENSIADALSRSDFHRAMALSPYLKIATFEPWSWSPDSNGTVIFQPPRGTLGAEKL
jgi:hypothetical protein